MVYLIGCDHGKAQTYRSGTSLSDPENRGQTELRNLILSAVARYTPELIAEEANTTILHNTQRQSIAHEVACESGIEHRFCEPTWDEKSELRIEEPLPFLGPCPPYSWEAKVPSVEVAYRHDIAHRWPIRENFWIDSLGEGLTSDVLFICGDAHRWTFRRRLEAKGIEVKLLAKRVGAQALSKDYFEAYREVRRKGFPPSTGCFCVSSRQWV